MKFLLAITCLATTSVFAAESGAAAGHFDLGEVFRSCPIIYSVLILMSIVATAIWLYSLMTLTLNDMMPRDLMGQMRTYFAEKKFDAAMQACQEQGSFTGKIIAAGLASRKHGPQLMIEAMKSEARRSGNSLWQRISLLNEIAVVAPMLGLLGTVVGLFLAFYNSGRTAESVASIFDGLGIAVGTTVVGLIVFNSSNDLLHDFKIPRGEPTFYD